MKTLSKNLILVSMISLAPAVLAENFLPGNMGTLDATNSFTQAPVTSIGEHGAGNPCDSRARDQPTALRTSNGEAIQNNGTHPGGQPRFQ